MYDVIKKIRKHWDFGLGRTALAAVCAHSVSISIGICQGYSAILIPQLMSSRNIEIDQEQYSWIASFGAITNPIGSIMSGLLAEWVGRKRSMQASSFPFLIGWLCIGAADNLTWLYAGRLITGIATGMSAASYTYVAEISTPTTRGIFQSLGPVSASFGILFVYILGYFIRWNLVAYISIVFGVFSFVTIQLLPESPTYLFKINERERCLDSLIWLRRSNAVAQEEFRGATKAAQTEDRDKDVKSLLLSPSTIKPFYILVLLFLLQEVSGIYTILFYAVNFFQDFNVPIDEHVSSLVVGVIRFVMSVCGAVLINRFGRRTLCTASSAGMAASMLAVVAYLKYFEWTGRERVWPALPLAFILLNVFFSMIGMLPVPWILVGEMFPARVRSVMGGVVICIAQVFIFVCVKIYPDMVACLRFSGTCVVFLVASLLAVFVSRFVLPETKNKSLEEIESDFRTGKLCGAGSGGSGRGSREFDSGSGGTVRLEKVFTVQVT